MTLGDFVMYVFFTGLVAAPLVQISSISTQLSEAFAGLDRIREIRSRSTELEQDQARAPLPIVVGHIAFEDVSFAYTEGVPVLKHISFEAPAGTTTALVRLEQAPARARSRASSWPSIDLSRAGC